MCPLSPMIQAVASEISRLGFAENLPAYFVHGKTGSTQSQNTLVVTFDNAPRRVLEQANFVAKSTMEDITLDGNKITFNRGETLIKVDGVFYVAKPSAPSPGILRVEFDLVAESARIGTTTPAALGQLLDAGTNNGIDFVIDSRNLYGHLRSFLSGKSPNAFLPHLVSKIQPVKVTGNPAYAPAGNGGLNASQVDAIQKALCQNITFIWGPPGTGKTTTMGALAAHLVQNGKRVILTAISHSAVDQLLLATLKRLNNVQAVSIARLGSSVGMINPLCHSYTSDAFQKRTFTALRLGGWEDQIRGSSLTAATLATLAYPWGAKPAPADYVIADEVSMASLPNLVVASYYAMTGMALGGDPAQLPTIYPANATTPNHWFEDNVFVKADIDSVNDPVKVNDPRVAFLDIQYRMQPQIENMVSRIFYWGRLKSGIPANSPVPGFPAHVVFLNCPVRTAAPPGGEQRRLNQAHAKIAADNVVKAINGGIPPEDIGVIAPYNAQVLTISNELKTLALSAKVPDVAKVKVSTVHSFQGQERRVIVMDITDDDVPPSHLTAKRELINVALSRAKDLLVIIGNAAYLQNGAYFRNSELAMFAAMLSGAGALPNAAPPTPGIPLAPSPLAPAPVALPPTAPPSTAPEPPLDGGEVGSNSSIEDSPNAGWDEGDANEPNDTTDAPDMPDTPDTKRQDNTISVGSPTESTKKKERKTAMPVPTMPQDEELIRRVFRSPHCSIMKEREELIIRTLCDYLDRVNGLSAQTPGFKVPYFLDYGIVDWAWPTRFTNNNDPYRFYLYYSEKAINVIRSVAQPQDQLKRDHFYPKALLKNDLASLPFLENPQIARGMLEKYGEICVITKDEDKALNAAGLQSKMPNGWNRENGDPFARYQACNIKVWMNGFLFGANHVIAPNAVGAGYGIGNNVPYEHGNEDTNKVPCERGDEDAYKVPCEHGNIDIQGKRAEVRLHKPFPNPGQDHPIFDELKKLIEQGKLNVDEIVFQGGGPVPIPDWFRDYCRDNNIKITIIPAIPQQPMPASPPIYPHAGDADLVEPHQITTDPQGVSVDHDWCINARVGFNAAVHKIKDPLIIRLWWKEDSNCPKRYVGLYVFHMAKLNTITGLLPNNGRINLWLNNRVIYVAQQTGNHRLPIGVI